MCVLFILHVEMDVPGRSPTPLAQLFRSSQLAPAYSVPPSGLTTYDLR